MTNFIFRKDYKREDPLRQSFCELATNIFGISFESWYQHGFWNDCYIPYSYIYNEKVIANVSVNVLDLVINNEKKRALQIGTVMTHPDYRNMGLSASLMNKVLKDYEGNYDIMYLFANHSVLDFYPKYGFKDVNETLFSLEYSQNKLNESSIRKLDGKNIDDLNFIKQFATDRIPVSQLFGTENTQGILMFYCMNVFYEDIYYIDHLDYIVIFKKDDKQINIFDIISKKEVNISEVLAMISDESTEKIVFHYTPQYQGVNFESNHFNGSEVLFVKSKSKTIFPDQFKHPITSQA